MPRIWIDNGGLDRWRKAIAIGQPVITGWPWRGGNEDAVRQWERLIQDFPDHRYWDDAWEQKAYTQWAYLDQYPQAVQTLLDFVDKVSAHSRAAEFLFDAAQVAERDGNLQQAAELWKRVADEYPSDERSSRALFLSGIAQYRRQDHTARILNAICPLLSPGKRRRANLWTGEPNMLWATKARLSGNCSQHRPYWLLQRRPVSCSRWRHPSSLGSICLSISKRNAKQSLDETTFGPPESENLARSAATNDPQLAGQSLHLGCIEDAQNSKHCGISGFDPAQSYRLTNYLYELVLSQRHPGCARYFPG
jgi:tetratricopeptide (TPR) repeat protein